MIKIAYIFFGQVKNFDQKQFWALENNVLKQLKGPKIDFFLTTSKNTKFVNPRQKSTEGKPQDIDYRSIEKFIDFKNIYYDNESNYPEKDIIDLSLKLLSKGGSWKEGDELKSISNSIKQIYGLEYFYNNFKNELYNYDYFILSRSDLFHTHPINLQFLTEDQDLWTPRYNIFPQIDYGNFGGLNDRFAIIKNPEALKSYCTRYSSIKLSPQKYHAEKYLKQQIESKNFNKGVIDDFIFEFVRSNGEISDIIGIEADPNMNRSLKNIDKTFVINLDRRGDRLNHFLQNSPIFANRYSAIDSNILKSTDEIEKLFKKSLSKITKAEIACSLSHYRLWKKLVKDNSCQNYLILEDDVVFEPGFESFWDNVFAKNLPTDYNLIYLGGCQPWNKPLYTKALHRYNDYFYNIKKNDFFTKDDHYWHMNAQSYIISKKGASLMCQYLDQFGFDLEKKQAQDIFMGKFFSNNKIFSDPNSVYHLYPPMTRQIHEENDNTEIDKNSDLRLAKETFSETQKKSLRAEDLFVPKKTNLTKFRCGRDEDGGYVLLKEIFNKIDTVYSYGIDDSEGSDSFDVECANSGKKVYMYDGTIDRQQSSNPSMIFKKENLTNENFKLHIQGSGDGDKVGMLLKMDIEGCEYPVIESNIDLIDKHFDMLCIEFHGLNNPEYYNFENKLEVIELLLQKYDIFHMHANNWVERKFKVPNVLEVSLIRKGTCLPEVDCAYPVQGLDFPNCKERDDYILDWWITKKQSESRSVFPNLQTISSNQIPKKIHLSWKDKNILSSSFKMIKKGAKNLETLNPEWDIEVSDDEDVNKYIRDNIGKSSWELIKDKKITEKTDLWRLLKVYKEGGMYIDIDRYIDTPISEIISENTECVIPTFQNIDFSQDFILSIQKNPMLERAISHNLFNRKSGKDLFYVAVHSYMHAVSEFLDGKMTDRGVNEEFFNKIRKQLSEDPKFSTYKETGPSNHILFRNLEKKFLLETYEQDKADFYNNQSVKHWNSKTEEKHKALKINKNNCLVFLNKNLFEEDFILYLFDKPEVIYNEGLDLIKPGATYVYSNSTSTEHVRQYPKSVSEKILNHQNSLRSFFDKLKGKNCNLIHVSDEHCHAEIDYYKNFNHVFRQYYREDAEADNVTFIPLGYKSGFIDE